MRRIDLSGRQRNVVWRIRFGNSSAGAHPHRQLDDHGGSRQLATPVTGQVKSGVLTFAANGAIGTAADADFFKLVLVAGQLTVRAAPLAGSDNLVVGIELQDAAGNVIARSNTATPPYATISFNVLTAGTFYLRSSSTAKNAAFGLYGPVGQYSLSGTLVATLAAGK